MIDVAHPNCILLTSNFFRIMASVHDVRAKTRARDTVALNVIETSVFRLVLRLLACLNNEMEE